MQAPATRPGARFIQHEATICAALAGERAKSPAVRATTPLALTSMRDCARVPDGFWRWVETLPSGKWRI